MPPLALASTYPADLAIAILVVAMAGLTLALMLAPPSWQDGDVSGLSNDESTLLAMMSGMWL